MSRTDTVNDRLATALAPYEDSTGVTARIAPEIRSALGMPAGVSFLTAEYPVVGFFLDQSSPTFHLDIITPGRYVRYELTAEGTSLTIVLPIERLMRIERWRTNAGDRMKLEFDADRTSATTTYRDGDPTVTTTTVFAYYDFESSAQSSSLEDFARAIANVLGR